MTIKEGDRLPEAKLSRMGPDGIEQVDIRDLTAGKKVAIFAVPGAFTPTCHSAHMPSFVRNVDAFAKKGVDAIYCISVNDPHVMRAWGEATGASQAGIGMLADSTGAYASALGMVIESPGAWIDGRSKRYAMYVEDGVVKVFHPEAGRGCEMSGGDALLASI